MCKGMVHYSTHSCFFSLALHWSQRSELGRTERLLETTSGYCVQFLHQCHRSGSAPLTYSSIPTLPNGKLCCNSYFSFAFVSNSSLAASSGKASSPILNV